MIFFLHTKILQPLFYKKQPRPFDNFLNSNLEVQILNHESMLKYFYIYFVAWVCTIKAWFKVFENTSLPSVQGLKCLSRNICRTLYTILMLFIEYKLCLFSHEPFLLCQTDDFFRCFIYFSMF